MKSAFTLDKRHAKIMGVCAGFANYTGWNVLAIRLTLVALTLFALGPVAIAVYLITGWIAND